MESNPTPNSQEISVNSPNSHNSSVELTPEKKRRGNPNWQKGGKTGNPNGRPKKVGPTIADLHRICVAGDLKAAAREFSAEALETLVTIMRDSSVSSNTRVTAANSILDRGFGKAVNQTEISVGIYDKLSNEELIKFIAGETVNSAAGIIEATALAVDSDPLDDNED